MQRAPAVGRIVPRTLFTKHQAFSRARARAAGQRPASTVTRVTRTGAAAGFMCLLHMANGAVHCAGSTEEEGDAAAAPPPRLPSPPSTDPADPADPADVAFDVKDLGIQLGVGTITGYSAGYALKKVGRAVAVLVGVGFIGLQALRYYGVVGDIRWDKVNTAIVKHLDTDDDGKVTATDVKAHFTRLTQFLSFGLPSSAAFGGAFLYGIKKG